MLDHSRREGGQALVLIVISLVAVLAGAALILDGGNAFAQQRSAQNAVDATAEAGATELVRRLAGVAPGRDSSFDAVWDARVVTAITAAASANRINLTLGSTYYTNIDGQVLGLVGQGTIPSGTAGVKAAGQRTFNTYIAGLIGMNQFTASVDATAVGGYATGAARASVIPVTVPILLTTCDGANRVTFPGGAPWPVGQTIALPICSNSPGNVGWIDWSPTAGGASELADAVTSPSNPQITTPKWYYVTATGNVNSGQVQTALESLRNTEVMIPIFYASTSDPLPGTCSSTPSGTRTLVTDCPTGDRGGNGSNQWYFLVTFGKFYLDEVYVQGSHSYECNDPGLYRVAGGNGGTSCLVGHFVEPVIESNVTVGPGNAYTTPWLTPLGVQLVR